MALEQVIAAIHGRLALVPGVVQVPDAPPPQLADDRMLLVYPQPGASTPMQHGGRTGQAVMQHRDVIVVEWHLKAAMDQAAVFLALGVPLFDLVRDLLWSEYVRHQFNGTVTLLTAINTDHFGEMGWGSDPTWGFRLLLDVMHAAEITAGKET